MKPNKTINIRIMYRAAMILLLGLPFLSCHDDDDQDMEYPVILMSSEDASPLNCAIVYRGEGFPFKAVFTDNRELGSYNIEIHNNFDHHSHSTENEECESDPKKQPVNPFIYNTDHVIPTGENHYTANYVIEVPDDVDTGDYNFMIRLTDKAGWQALKAVSIKIREREVL